MSSEPPVVYHPKPSAPFKRDEFKRRHRGILRAHDVLQPRPEPWRGNPSSQAAVATELSTISPFDHVHNDLPKACCLLIGQLAPVDEADQVLLGVTRAVKPGIRFEKTDGALKCCAVAVPQSLEVLPEPRG